MTYFTDLSPYSYGYRHHPGVVHVGWLDGMHPFQQGDVQHFLIEKMRSLAAKPVELYRGKHICELCREPPGIVKAFVPGKGRLLDLRSSWWAWADQRSGNGEIRVAGEGVIFAAPVLIVHYIEGHSYLPPVEFLEAVAKAGWS